MRYSFRTADLASSPVEVVLVINLDEGVLELRMGLSGFQTVCDLADEVIDKFKEQPELLGHDDLGQDG